MYLFICHKERMRKKYLIIGKKRKKLKKMRLPAQDLSKSSNECWQSKRNSRSLCDKPHLEQISDSPLCKNIWLHHVSVKSAIQNSKLRFSWCVNIIFYFLCDKIYLQMD